MASHSGDTIWELVGQAAEALPEPFSRSALINWIVKRRPDVELTSISTHIQYAIAETPNRHRHNLGARPPQLQRVDRGLYRRYRPQAETPMPVPAGTSAPLIAPTATESRVLLIGCSRTKADVPAPARELFRGPVFQRARDYAVRQGVLWFVLSGKFGLLDPDDVVSPYDVYLAKQSSSYRRTWGEWVTSQLAQRMPLPGVTFEIHAGESYCAPLREPLTRHGASVVTPLAGLGYGERLAWPGYRPDASVGTEPQAGRSQEPSVVADLDRLLDSRNAWSPAEFLAAGSDGRDGPGLYTWWVDEDGARVLSVGIGQPLHAGLIYAGKAGGHRERAAPSMSTLWGRVAGNHLRGNVGSSTFRKSLAAILGAAGQPNSEQDLTSWMHAHLRVATLPVASERVSALEDELVSRTDPPLNLAGVPTDAGRSALARLRSMASRHPGPPQPAGGDLSTTLPAPSGPLLAFERRIRADVGAMVRSGYRPTIFELMLAEHGAVEAVRRLLVAPRVSDGFRYLWEHGMLQHSVENAVLAPESFELFSDTERGVARTRLREAGFEV